MPRPKFSDRFQSIVEWVENNIYLSKNTPIPGRIKLYEWQKGILGSVRKSGCSHISIDDVLSNGEISVDIVHDSLPHRMFPRSVVPSTAWN